MTNPDPRQDKNVGWDKLAQRAPAHRDWLRGAWRERGARPRPQEHGPQWFGGRQVPNVDGNGTADLHDGRHAGMPKTGH
jgi:hypothetical protein